MIEIIANSYLVDKNEFFIIVLNFEELEKKPKKVVEGTHFDFVKVKITGARLEPEWGGKGLNYEIILELEPLSAVPVWLTDHYDWFENASVECLLQREEVSLNLFTHDFELDQDIEIVWKNQNTKT
jgi:hypothetical protein